MPCCTGIARDWGVPGVRCCACLLCVTVIVRIACWPGAMCFQGFPLYRLTSGSTCLWCFPCYPYYPGIACNACFWGIARCM